MLTTQATICNLMVNGSKIWIELKVVGNYFAVHHEFDTALLSDYSKVKFILDNTKARTLDDIKGKDIRVIVTGNEHDSLIAIGDLYKNLFIDMKRDEFPVSDRRIYWRYRKRA